MDSIGIKGILQGIADMLTTDGVRVEEVTVRMDCARKMLLGVIQELTPMIIANYTGSSTDPEAEQAKKELK